MFAVAVRMKLASHLPSDLGCSAHDVSIPRLTITMLSYREYIGSGLRQGGGASRESGRRTEEIRWLACLLMLDQQTGLPSALGD